MPTNTLTRNQMSKILHEQFRGVAQLGFTAAGVGKIFPARIRNESSFTWAAATLCANKKLIEGILQSCPAIRPINLEKILSKTGHDCAAVIQKLHGRRTDIAKVMLDDGFSGANISTIMHGSQIAVSTAIDALINHKEALLSLIDNGFSASNISAMLSGSGSKLNESIQGLINNQEKLLSLIQKGFSLAEISALLQSRGANLVQAIQELNEHSTFMLGLIKSGNLSYNGLRSELREHVSKISKAIWNNPPIAHAAKKVVFNQKNFVENNFLTDLAWSLFFRSNNVEDHLLSGTDVLIKRRATLLELHTSCGFSANNIADILKGSEANLDKSIGELNRKKVLLFGLIQEGRFTADELADKLHGSGVKVDEVFKKDPDIRLALHASYRDMMSLAPANKRPRFA